VKSEKGCTVPLHRKGLCQTKGLQIVEQVITQSLLVTRENNYAEEPTTAMKLLFHNEPDTLEKSSEKLNWPSTEEEPILVTSECNLPYG